MLLQDGEHYVHQSSAHYLFSGDRRGILFLTNLRLVFEVHENHIFAASEDATLVEISLEKIQDIHVSSPSFRVGLGGNQILRVSSISQRFDFGIDNPTAWCDQIIRARQNFRSGAFLPPPPPPPPQPMELPPPPPGFGASPVVVNVVSPQASAPAPQVMFRCHYCKRVYPETEGKCPQCGASF